MLNYERMLTLAGIVLSVIVGRTGGTGSVIEDKIVKTGGAVGSSRSIALFARRITA